MDNIINKREAQLISKILYKLYSIEDNSEMRQTVLSLIPNLIHCSKASFYLGCPRDDCFMEHPVGYCMSDDLLAKYLEYDTHDYMNGIFVSSETEVYRETDYFLDEVRINTPYFRDLLEPNDMYYSVQICLYFSEIFLGVVTLFRGKNDVDFSDHELFLLTLIKDHLALRLYQDHKKSDSGSSRSGTQKYIDTYGLTAREAEVLTLIFRGLTNEEMADALSISHFTIQKHISNIYKKMNISSKSQLFRLDSDRQEK